MGIAALVLGIIAIVFGCFAYTGFMGIIGLILGIVAIVLGALGKKNGAKCATAGLVCGIIGTVLCGILFVGCYACFACAACAL